MSQTPCKRRQEGRAIDHTPGAAVSAGQVVVLGTNLVTIANLDIAAGRLGALQTDGLWIVPKDDSDISGPAAAYWDADGNPVGGTAGSGAFSSDPTKGPFAGWFLNAAGVADGTVLLALNSKDSATAVARSALVQDDLQSYPIPVTALHKWDAPAANAEAAGANDDLGVIYNTFLTAGPSIETGDVKAGGAISRKVGFQFVVPPEYVAGQTATLRVKAGMKTTVADTTATVDVQAARQADPTTDICTTNNQSINSLVAANKDFTLDPTSLVPGDVVDVVVTVATNDAATGTAVIGKIYSLALLLDIKG